MSRSRRKNKIRGITTAESEKWNKRDANRKLRRIVNQKFIGEDQELPRLKELSSVWVFAKDGKIYDPRMGKKDMRIKKWLLPSPTN